MVSMKLRPLLLAAASAAFVTPTLVQAQEATSREVVQPMPSPEVQRLNRALMELARAPREIDALLEAADASLALDDFDAAIGFYGRADSLDPSDPRVKLGMARVYLRSGRPVEALPLFAEARAAGARPVDLLSDQALAFDLVGNQESAQIGYLGALELDPRDNEARRRLALSYAIAGNGDAFQTTLAPLLEVRDFAAFRTRAFGLAILGEQERAEAIVDAVMPRDLAARINPYLAYMPRLTSGQQAAAANLGIFPRAAEIGRDDPRIARFAQEGTVGSRLEPAGEPLGAEAPPPSQSVPVPVPAPAQASVQSPAPALAEQSGGLDEPANVTDAFADMGAAELPEAASSTAAVDLNEIEIPLDEPPEPEHPRRIWVQVATGRDVNALRFDWRRFVRRAPELLGEFEPYVTPWGQANRLLAGPVASRAEARALINALAAKGLDTFSYTSPEGTVIQPLR